MSKGHAIRLFATVCLCGWVSISKADIRFGMLNITTLDPASAYANWEMPIVHAICDTLCRHR